VDRRPTFGVFQPWFVVVCSFAGAGLLSLYQLQWKSIRATALEPSGALQYFVPLMVPMIAIMFERAAHAREANTLHHGVDFLMFGLAIGRVVGDVQYVSGHTLLLSYALLSSRSNFVRVTAALVMVQTLLLKYFAWGDFVTSNVGIVLGAIAAFVVNRFGQKNEPILDSPAT
jgi:hypothetical protein